MTELWPFDSTMTGEGRSSDAVRPARLCYSSVEYGYGRDHTEAP
jgi:hypothetical protein